ncbi:MAG: Tad domain-containing protein [Actinomycetota bacterium]
MKHIFNLNEKGAITILVASALAMLITVAALVVDLGLLYQERRQLQTAVDAAALAAAIDLAEGRDAEQAEVSAERYIIENTNVSPEQITIDYPGANRVRVICTTSRNLLLAKVFGVKDAPVKATATAAYDVASSVSNLVPIIVPLQSVTTHIGQENEAQFELGEDRPVESFSKTATVDKNTIKYTISYINTTNKSVDITIEDPIPKGATYVKGGVCCGCGCSCCSSCTCSQCGGCDCECGCCDRCKCRCCYHKGTNTIAWKFRDIPSGERRTVSFMVTTSSSSAVMNNTAYLTTSASSETETASTSGSAQKGYFWLCDFDTGGGGTPDFDDWIRHGYPEEVSIGFVANGEGVRAALKDALSWRKEHDPSVVLPLYDYTKGGGSPGKYHIVGFAEFVITNFDLKGNPKTINGYFTNGTVTTGAGGEEKPPYDFGIFAVWLVD